MLAVNWLTQISNERMSGDCLLPALVHRTFACMSALLWTASSSARQTAHLSVSISTTATKHLPGCAHKASLSFAKIPNWDGQQRRLFYPSWTQSMARKTIKLMSSTTEGEAKIGQAACMGLAKAGQADRTLFHVEQFFALLHHWEIVCCLP